MYKNESPRRQQLLNITFCLLILLFSLVASAQSTTSDIKPTQIIATGSGVSALAVGDNHSCVVISGGVRCWGLNPNGQLGNNTQTGSANPLIAIPEGSGASAIAVGNGHSCAIVSGGVLCWGNNDAGQLGDGTQTRRLTPVQIISAGGGVSTIAAGEYETCAVVNGGLQCWGTKSPLTPSSIVSSPKQVIAAGYGVTQAAMSSTETCAIIDGGLSCWLGSACANANAPAKNCALPTPIYPANSKVTGLELFGTATCILVDGGVTCHDRFTLCGPQVGITLSPPCNTTHFSRSAVPAQSMVESVGIRYSYFCISTGGGVSCRNYSGGGDGRFAVVEPYGAEFIQIIPSRFGVTAIDAAKTYACALNNGGVACWGRRPEATLPVPIAQPPYPSAVSRYRINVMPTQGHLFTTDLNEYNTLTQPVNGIYIAEGVDHKIYKDAVTKEGQTTVPYYRLFIKGIRQHFWTTDANEYNALRAQTSNFSDEGIDGYLFLTPGVSGTVPLYRMVLNGTAIHHWTTDANEFKYLAANGWSAEGAVGNPNGVTGYVEPK